jgi:hypothetical protein
MDGGVWFTNLLNQLIWPVLWGKSNGISLNPLYLILSMKKFRSILSFGFACLVLVSSTSFMVGIHHCGGHVKHLALFTKAAPCEMEQQVAPCHRVSANSCCQDLTVVHQDEDFNGSATSVDVSPSLEADASTTMVVAEVVPTSVPVLASLYHPPLLAVDRPVALRVFLI